jgi:hypothetical protein
VNAQGFLFAEKSSARNLVSKNNKNTGVPCAKLIYFNAGQRHAVSLIFKMAAEKGGNFSETGGHVTARKPLATGSTRTH